MVAPESASYQSFELDFGFPGMYEGKTELE